jgi:hypothetical protein
MVVDVLRNLMTSATSEVARVRILKNESAECKVDEKRHAYSSDQSCPSTLLLQHSLLGLVPHGPGYDDELKGMDVSERGM